MRTMLQRLAIEVRIWFLQAQVRNRKAAAYTLIDPERRRQFDFDTARIEAEIASYKEALRGLQRY